MTRESTEVDTRTPAGFSEKKGTPNYWLDACRDFWAETGLDTDTEELRWIVNWFDNRRREQGQDDHTGEQSGFTEGEKRCHDALMNSYREFIGLQREHPSEMRDFVDAVHRIQGLLTMRIARRSYPEYWPTYGDIPEEEHV